jgi:protein-S-isoprenylcysteine O-methyltransferase Ste14
MKFKTVLNFTYLKIKLTSILYGVVCHITFAISGLCMFWVLYKGFTVSLGSVRYPLSIIINIFLLLQFPILHSFLLTNSGRRFLRFFAPRNYAKTLETTIYATIASIQLLLLFLLWTPSNIVIYDLKYPVNVLNFLFFILGWILLAISSFQAGYKVQTGSLGWISMFLSEKPKFPPMPVNGLFKLMRQPIYFSFCIVLWTSPTMTLDLFFLAFCYSLYCYFSPLLKEKRFTKLYGEAFLNYKKNTPYFFPTQFFNFITKK